MEVRVKTGLLEDRERGWEKKCDGAQGGGKVRGGYDLLCSFVTHEYVAMLTVEN